MQVDFDMPIRLDAVDPMVQTLRAAAQPFLDTATLFGFEISVTEALTNIVRHAYSDMPTDADSVVHVKLKCDATGVTIATLDHGKLGPVDLFSRPRAFEEIDILADSGRGIALIQYYSDSADYNPGPNGNQLILRFSSRNEAQP